MGVWQDLSPFNWEICSPSSAVSGAPRWTPSRVSDSLLSSGLRAFWGASAWASSMRDPTRDDPASVWASATQEGLPASCFLAQTCHSEPFLSVPGWRCTLPPERSLCRVRRDVCETGGLGSFSFPLSPLGQGLARWLCMHQASLAGTSSLLPAGTSAEQRRFLIPELCTATPTTPGWTHYLRPAHPSRLWVTALGGQRQLHSPQHPAPAGRTPSPPWLPWGKSSSGGSALFSVFTGAGNHCEVLRGCWRLLGHPIGPHRYSYLIQHWAGMSLAR